MLTARRMRFVTALLIAWAGTAGMLAQGFIEGPKDSAPSKSSNPRAKLRRQLVAERKEVRKQGAILEAQAKAIGVVKRDLKAKIRWYRSLVYDLCPNGCTFNGCIHEDRKQQWAVFIQQVLLEIQQLRDELSERIKRFEPALEEFVPVAQTLNKKLHDYNKDNMTFKKYNKKDEDYLNYYESKILGIKAKFQD